MPELHDKPVSIASKVTTPMRGRRRRVETREELLSRLLDPTLTLEETAIMLNVCPTTVRRYTNRGILPHERSKGNQRRFKLSSVLAFLEATGQQRPDADRESPEAASSTRTFTLVSGE